jgi:hypothetical protein
VVLTSFLLYQLPAEVRAGLVRRITEFTQAWGGQWINLEVEPGPVSNRFFIQVDGVDRIDLDNDLCFTWRPHGG